MFCVLVVWKFRSKQGSSFNIIKMNTALNSILHLYGAAGFCFCLSAFGKYMLSTEKI